MLTHSEIDTASQPRVDRLKVLLADPMQAAGSPLLTELKKCGLEVFVARTLDDAFDIVSNESIDLALLELRFEGVDCLRLIAEIRALNPTSRIVVHTWLADVRATVAVVKAGADDLLPKPLEPAFVVAFLLNGHSPESDYLENILILRLFGFLCGIAIFDHMFLISQMCFVVVLDFRRRLTAALFSRSHRNIGSIMFPCRPFPSHITVRSTTARS